MRPVCSTDSLVVVSWSWRLSFYLKSPMIGDTFSNYFAILTRFKWTLSRLHYSIRGVLSSSVVVSTYVGILIAFIMGKYCNFYTTPLVTVALTILFVAMFSMFPESPTFLIKQNRLTVSISSARIHSFKLSNQMS